MSFKEDLLARVLIAPITTEKTTIAGDRENSVAFWVLPSATKFQVKAAVEKFFDGVEVEKVSTSIKPRDFTRFGNNEGRKKKMKKAYVKLKAGHEINFAEMASN